jgi:hypothetical protein
MSGQVLLLVLGISVFFTSSVHFYGFVHLDFFCSEVIFTTVHHEALNNEFHDSGCFETN